MSLDLESGLLTYTTSIQMGTVHKSNRDLELEFTAGDYPLVQQHLLSLLRESEELARSSTAALTEEQGGAAAREEALSVSLSQQEGVCAQLQRELSASEEAKGGLALRVEELTQRTRELQATLLDAKEQLATAANSETTLSAQNDALQTRVREMTETVERHRAEESQMRDKLGSLREELATRKSELGAEKTRSAELSMSLSGMSQELDSVRAQLTDKKSEAASQAVSLSQASKARQEVEAALAEERGRAQQATQELSEWRTKAMSAETRCTSIEARFRHAEEINGQYGKAAEDAVQRISDLEEQRDQDLSTIAQLREDIGRERQLRQDAEQKSHHDLIRERNLLATLRDQRMEGDRSVSPSFGNFSPSTMALIQQTMTSDPSLASPHSTTPRRRPMAPAQARGPEDNSPQEHSSTPPLHGSRDRSHIEFTGSRHITPVSPSTPDVPLPPPSNRDVRSPVGRIHVPADQHSSPGAPRERESASWGTSGEANVDLDQAYLYML
ncbi:hypothetical protein KIPB_011263, partial [Kipferlia bialata]|eukprot:g11263.t1